MKELLKEIEAVKDGYLDEAQKAREEGDLRTSNEYLDKHFGISEAILIMLRSEHGHKFI
jgi:hypothetical protein